MPSIKFLFSAFVTLFALEAYAQSFVPIAFGYEEAPFPKRNSIEWNELNSSFQTCQVEIINGQVVARNITQENKSCSLEIHNGTLVGTDYGEWGGSLTFYPADTVAEPVEVMRGNIKFLFMFEDKICILEGTEHLLSEGALYQLDTFGGQFRYRIQVNLKDAPMAYTIYQDKLMVATYDKFYIVQSGSIELAIEEVFWYALYPNSIAVWDHNNVFIGFRGGFARLDPGNGRMRFYKKSR